MCPTHGGRAPQVKAAATARLAAAAAARDVTTYGARRDIDPAAALLELVSASAGHVTWLAARVAETDAKALTVGVAEQRIGPTGEKTVVIRSQPNVWLTLYNSERRFLAEVAAAALRAGVEERAVRLAERQGRLLCEVIAAVIADLDLTEAQRDRASEAVPRHLRAVADAEAAGLGWAPRAEQG